MAHLNNPEGLGTCQPKLCVIYCRRNDVEPRAKRGDICNRYNILPLRSKKEENRLLSSIGVVIFGTGIGLSSLLRSIFVEALSAEHAAFAISSISAAKTVGGSISGPIYSYALAISMDMTGFFRGLPFLLSALCFVVVATILARVGRIMLQKQGTIT